MLLADMEMPFNYVEEDSNLNLIDQNKFKCLKSANNSTCLQGLHKKTLITHIDEAEKSQKNLTVMWLLQFLSHYVNIG